MSKLTINALESLALDIRDKNGSDDYYLGLEECVELIQDLVAEYNVQGYERGFKSGQDYECAGACTKEEQTRREIIQMTEHIKQLDHKIQWMKDDMAAAERALLCRPLSSMINMDIDVAISAFKHHIASKPEEV